MANAFYAGFGRCRRKGYTKAYCYREVSRELAKERRGPSRRRRKKKGVAPKGPRVAKRGSTCIKKTKVWSPALGKKVFRCTGGYRSGRRRRR